MLRTLWTRWLTGRPSRRDFVSESPEVAKLHRRLLSVLAAREGLRWGAAWIALWALAAVIARGLMWTDRTPLLWGSIGLLGVVAVAVFLGRRKTPSKPALLAALDSHSRLGGILMTAGEQDIGSWQERVRQPILPRVRWNARKEWRFLAASLVFLIVAFAIPDRIISQEGESRLEIAGEIQHLTDKLQLLREEDVVKDKEADELKRNLEKIRDDARGRDPEKTLEAIDHLNAMLSKSASDVANKIVQEVQSEADVQAAAQNLAGARSEGNTEATGDAMKQLAQQWERAAQEGALVKWGDTGSEVSDISEMMAKAFKDGDLSQEQMNALMLSMKQCQGCRQARLKKLCDGKLIDPSFFVESEEEFDSDKPGRGGTSRGRGDAALTWKQPSEMGDAQFKETPLPASPVGSLNQAPLLGLSASDPTVKGPTEDSTGNVLNEARAGSGEARTERLLPKYKRTVQQYFERGGK